MELEPHLKNNLNCNIRYQIESFSKISKKISSKIKGLMNKKRVNLIISL
ncbi:hypothetical protein MY1_1328 [Nitrosarchaeum koreense MY1]|uniref:Uncharacterized protein n=1 Tax=Nitrosarchaeum koreense MY1 TaxID=1001994 RepID=F9CXW9_9ARCH|nr:hypothetical protein MY1_1328 [Nitrosarchaeum koreense MY1]